MTTLARPQRSVFISQGLAGQGDVGYGEACPADAQAPHAAVLLVDESRLARIAAGRIIQQIKGLAVIEARGGPEALEILARESPSVVLSDLDMSGMNGLELVAQIRTFHPQTPVVLMTAHGSEQVVIQALRAGATNYVPKARWRRSCRRL